MTIGCRSGVSALREQSAAEWFSGENKRPLALVNHFQAFIAGPIIGGALAAIGFLL
jgi:hypothetical protein